MKTIENEQLVETIGGYRFTPGYYPYAPVPYPPAYAAPRAAYWPYAYGACGAYGGGWWGAPPAIAARRAWWW